MKKHNQKSNEELIKLQEQVAEMENKWKRALADYQNLEKRTQHERAAFVKLATIPLMAKLLPVLDDLERATLHLKDRGVEMVMRQFSTVLKDEGLMEINPIGQDFDAETMEAVDKAEGDENKVITVTQKGYSFNGMTVRPAKVIVGIKNKNTQ